MIPIYDAAQVGLSQSRLDRIPHHLNRYVDEGKLPGYLVMVARQGKPAYLHHYGFRDVETQRPVTEDTIFRIYSMTKPITSVALLQLYEQGFFQLDDPVSRFIPAFANLQVYASGEGNEIRTMPPERAVTFRDLLTHTAGFTYGKFGDHPVDHLYLANQVRGGTLVEMIERVSQLPLLFAPGSRWNYSIATDILGYLIEIIAGQKLDNYFAEHILDPLGMVDTAFWVSAEKRERFAANYNYHEGGMKRIETDPYTQIPQLLSGGGGLVSTVADYFRFAQMLLNQGELDGVRVLGRKTVELMTSNHMPNNGDLASMGVPIFSETTYSGIGFGLGVSVLLDPAKAQILGSAGEYAWGGAASTAFWVDPVEEQIVIFLTQLMPSSTYPIRRELRVLTYSAIVD